MLRFLLAILLSITLSLQPAQAGFFDRALIKTGTGLAIGTVAVAAALKVCGDSPTCVRYVERYGEGGFKAVFAEYGLRKTIACLSATTCIAALERYAGQGILPAFEQVFSVGGSDDDEGIGVSPFVDAGTASPMPDPDEDEDLPRVEKVVNTNMDHAIEQGVDRQVFVSREEARQVFEALKTSIRRQGWPRGTILDTRESRVLVPVGRNGYAVYKVQANGTAQLRTTLLMR